MVNPSGTNARLSTRYSHRYAGTPAMLLAPKIEYKGDTFEAVLRGSYSTSEFNFRDNDKGFFSRTDTHLSRIGFTLDRPSDSSKVLTQTAGRPWGDPNSYNRDDDIGNNLGTSESDARNLMYGTNLDLKKEADFGPVPVSFMAGGGARVNDWKTDEGAYDQFQYVGSTADLTEKALEAVVPATQNYQFAINGFNAGNLNDQNWLVEAPSSSRAFHTNDLLPAHHAPEAPYPAELIA